ncbi:MAG: hypothetical protein KKH68_00325, partial [Proteobacteria bacterium]|nr:hypothetical protein [Pseudomonadota bacterium]
MHMLISPRRGTVQPALRGCKNLVMILLIMAGACGDIKAESGVEAIFSAALPLPEWKLAEQPYRYIPPNLYEYINGAAEFFIAYGFTELAGANYAPVSGDKDTVTVDIYDMGNKLNAFGVFQ